MAKAVCIIVGVVLILATIFPAPFGLLLESASMHETSRIMDELIKDGTLIVDRDRALARPEASMLGLRADAGQLEAESTARWMVARRVAIRVQPLGLGVMAATFLVGLLLLVVGLTSPRRARLPMETVCPVCREVAAQTEPLAADG